MAWFDELIPAKLSSSVGSVDFGLVSAGKTGGRRTEAHEFADVDGAWVEDSGGMPHRYQVQAFLVGDDYHVELQRLEEILDGSGPLEFDHPFRGPIGNLHLEGEYSTEEDVERLGFAKITFTLVQSGAPEPLIFESLAALTSVRAGAVFAASQSLFEAEYSGQDILGSATRALDRLGDAMVADYNDILSVFGPIDDIRNAINSFKGQVATLASVPQQIGSKLLSVVRKLNSLTAKRAKGLGRPPSGFGNPLQTLTDSATNLAQANQTEAAEADSDAVTGGEVGVAKKDLDALLVLTKSASLGALTETLVSLELPTADAAQALSDFIGQYADDLLEAQIGDEPISSELFDAVLQLKVDVAALLKQLKDDLPTVVTLEAPSAMPLTLLAFSQGGSTGKGLSALVHAFMIANTIEDPLEIPSGTVLQVVLP